MGQKVNPNGIRIGITHSWPSHWFAKGSRFRSYLLQDVQIKKYIRGRLRDAGISKIEIERSKKVSIVIHTSKPGVIIGKQGAAIEELRKDIERTFGITVTVDIQEVRSPESDAEVIAETIQGQIERRMPYRRAVKMSLEKAMQAGAVGVKITVSGRLNGAEIARGDLFKSGNIPLQTLRANVQYARRHALTKYGTIGIQVWVYKGMVFKKIEHVQSSALQSS
ncbi:30S ribosomal protein S3 [Candidatus Peregrinibacteria bacterium CG10_big_fil_rev_8_21_14_0_10_49_16]|nr:MAG: 30S ribosomal protein S3 [Candidatus Peregrinibacteria bacterium CG22_combo_CG10-13_8_21_14_all_49_11]PIR51829.1 MAG: 30S ribosomal protein S3 [Candidatus Peregrinibacteria bacterium CG10_big_fil_rev_8_21_14_0_10_49_16]